MPLSPRKRPSVRDDPSPGTSGALVAKNHAIKLLKGNVYSLFIHNVYFIWLFCMFRAVLSVCFCTGLFVMVL